MNLYPISVSRSFQYILKIKNSWSEKQLQILMALEIIYHPDNYFVPCIGEITFLTSNADRTYPDAPFLNRQCLTASFLFLAVFSKREGLEER